MSTVRLPVGFLADGSSARTDSTITDRVSLMHDSALFNGVTQTECLQIAAGAQARVYARNEILFMQGHPIRHVLMVQSGCVKLTQLSSTGNEVILWLNGKTDAIGAHGLSAGCSHTCSAHVIERCKILAWDSTRFERLMTECPQIRRNISRIQSDRLNELQERFREIATEKVSKRVAFALVRLARQVGKKAIDGVEVSLSREELAQMTGTTLFTISRLMSKWSEMGLVFPRREAVLVRDTHGLMHLSGAEE